jgi:hypothetical protein
MLLSFLASLLPLARAAFGRLLIDPDIDIWKRRQYPSTVLTTVLAKKCSTPTCTILIPALTSITIAPSPLTTLFPDGTKHVTVIFNAITTAIGNTSIMLENTGTNPLTLPKTTLESLTTSATVSYGTSPSQPMKTVVVELDIKATIQLALESNGSDSCPVYSQDLRRALPRSGLAKLSRRQLMAKYCNPTETNVLIAAIQDAATLLYPITENYHETDAALVLHPTIPINSMTEPLREVSH